MMDTLKKQRYKAWLNKDITPPIQATEMSDEVLGEILEVIVEEWSIFDRRTIFITEAAQRLHKQGPFHVVDVDDKDIGPSVED